MISETGRLPGLGVSRVYASVLLASVVWAETAGNRPGGSNGRETLAEAAKGPKELTLALPAEGEVVGVLARTGKGKDGVRVRFGAAGKGAALLTVASVNMPNLNHHWGTTPVPAGLEDAALALGVSGAPEWDRAYGKHYFIRPDVHFYLGEDQKKALERWNESPPASQHWFDLRLLRTGGKVEISIDGRFFTRFRVVDTWGTLTLSLGPEAELRSAYRETTAETDRYVPLDISVNPHRGPLKAEDPSVGTGIKDIRGIPVNVVPADQHIDVGLARWLGQAQDSMDFYSPYYKRSCWDNLPESIILSVPKRFYNYAHVLCAVEPTEGKSPTMGVRVARYRQAWDGTGGTQADTNIRVQPKSPQGLTSIRKVGKVKALVGGEQRSLPLYLVEIPLKTGELADFLGEDRWDSPYERTDYLYLEFAREIRTRVARNYGVFENLPLGAQSGIHIFGVTLEKAPVAVAITSAEVGNVFYRDAAPALSIELLNPSQETFRLSMEAKVTDFWGIPTDTKQALDLKPGLTRVSFDLKEFKLGWYSAEFRFTDGGGRLVWSQAATFALLPPDTRKAGDESPYGTWWFAGNHYDEPQADRVMPLLQKMGFRHVTPQAHNPKVGSTPENLARYKVTPSMMSFIRGKDPEAEAAKFAKEWPGTRYAMIFHETGLGGLGLELPPELLGKPPLQLEGDNQKQYEALREAAIRQAEIIRKALPGAKIILGNGGTNFNVHWLRTRLPRQYWDCVGMEMAVQLFHPESQPTGWDLQSLWIAKRMREIYGYDDLPVTSCYEFDYRATAPGALSLEDQANWYVRDVLHGLAYRMPNINVALIMDCNSAYYTSRWGSTGVCFRAPAIMPKPSFVGLAILTQALDTAQYQRYLDTGSHQVYCLEFQRDKEFVYALWTARGRREAELALGQPGTLRITDLMGRETVAQAGNGSHTLTATESALFVTTASKLASAKAANLADEKPDMAGVKAISRLNDLNEWRIVGEGNPDFETYCAYVPLCKGKFQVGKGKENGLQLILEPQPDVPDLVGRYVVLEPKAGPLPIRGAPKRLGVWVNGNSNWGRIVFEVLDAKGRRWTSNGWEEERGSWDMSDWEARTSINFDGWRFISVGLDLHYPCGYYAPDFRHWRCQGDNSITNQIAYPLKFNRLYVIMRQGLVYVTDMLPAKSMSIELKDLTSFQ